MNRNTKRVLEAHPLPWTSTTDVSGDYCVEDANGETVCYPQGDCSELLADLIAVVVSYHAEDEVE